MSDEESQYVIVEDSGGMDYREIADIMTELGNVMNHTSARNYVMRIVKKFALALLNRYERKLDDAQLNALVKSAIFQQRLADVLHRCEPDT